MQVQYKYTVCDLNFSIRSVWQHERSIYLVVHKCNNVLDIFLTCKSDHASKYLT